jgi:quinol-cytochrome oxidoreductase complex cytochrome b subunit
MPTMMLLNAFVDAMPGTYRGPLVAVWLCLLIPLFVLNLRRVGRLHREGLTL